MNKGAKAPLFFRLEHRSNLIKIGGIEFFMAMNDCRVMHETIVGEVIDTIDFFKKMDPEEFMDYKARKNNPYNSTSLVRKTTNLICVFPVMVSTNISINAASMIAKAIERKAATMLQLLFGSIQTQNMSDMEGILNQFHKNIKLNDKMNVDDMLRIMDSISESYNAKLDYSALQTIREDMKNINFYFEENVAPAPISSFSVNRDPYNRNLMVESFGDTDRARRNGRNNPSRNQNVNNGDYKKANEVMPTTITVTYYYIDDTGHCVPIENSVVGVKARLIPCDAGDIQNHFIAKYDDTNWITQFLRATTREISFVKDFLLMIDRAKIDALSVSRRGSSNPMWKVLERRAMGSKIKRLLNMPNNYMAITTVAVSQEDVDYVKRNNNIDFENPSIIQSLFNKLNLMSVVIVDESLEVAKFMFDTGEGNWENYAFTSLEREDKDNTYKKVVNLMTKVAR